MNGKLVAMGMLSLAVMIVGVMAYYQTGLDPARSSEARLAGLGSAPIQAQQATGSAVQPGIQYAAPKPAAANAPAGGSCGMGGGCGCGGGAAKSQPAKALALPGVDAQVTDGVQVVSVRALGTGAYDKPKVKVKAGIPVRFDFSADANAGCGRQLILDGFNVQLVSRDGETASSTFTPTTPGDFEYHCGMYMFRGILQVV